MNAGLMPDAVHLTDDALDVVVSQFAVEILLIVAAQDVHVQRQQDERFARRVFQYVLGQSRDRKEEVEQQCNARESHASHYARLGRWLFGLTRPCKRGIAMAMNRERREFLKLGVAGVGASALAHLQRAARCQAAAAEEPGGAIVVDPKPLFDLSPHLYMQFMEPLGTTDSSVEAAWSYDADTWRQDFIDATKDLAPGMMRYGGLLSRYYKWREGVGPAENRPLMRNYL